MDDVKTIEAEIENVVDEATDTAEDILRPSGTIEDTLSDALASVRRAIVEQPVTAVLLVGAFAFLYGLNRRA